MRVGDNLVQSFPHSQLVFAFEAQTFPPKSLPLLFAMILLLQVYSTLLLPCTSSSSTHNHFRHLKVPASPVADVRLIARIRHRKVKGKDLPHPRNRHLAFNHRDSPLFDNFTTSG